MSELKEQLTTLANERRNESEANKATNALLDKVKNSDEYQALFTKAWSAKEIQNVAKERLVELGLSLSERRKSLACQKIKKP